MRVFGVIGVLLRYLSLTLSLTNVNVENDNVVFGLRQEMFIDSPTSPNALRKDKKTEFHLQCKCKCGIL